MNFVKKCLCRIGQCLQTVVRVLRRTVCCCRRKKVGCIIPLSLEDRERYALVDAMQVIYSLSPLLLILLNP